MNNNKYLLDEYMMLVNGDCIEHLRTLDDPRIKVDAVITDPPYGTTALDWDNPISFSHFWDEAKRLFKPTTNYVLFGQEPFSSFLRLSNYNDYRYDIYWQKERLTNIFQVKRRPGKTVETISVFFDKQGTYNPQMVDYNGPLRKNKIKDGRLGKLVDKNCIKPLEYNDTGKRYPTDVLQFKRDILTSNLHPTQKPLELMKWLVNTYTNEGDLVLDFAMGSGTTGVACVELNRRFIGIEKDTTFFKIACNRISSAIKEKEKENEYGR